ncbi:hypothetical protein GPECTOR_6g489 [Gonium pectorale]|uniref:histidine kinase n=1 Tax=Gonium pectorale TaxID=33097 RepID=A0A150GV47_GONPE|nr:hypothetical protein GPECTOR_6g489 [Gonium pectorale]|eukprot:KXZ53572.1 hypothetical protein GPECTOR_6g489 [Gonium pectorale]
MASIYLREARASSAGARASYDMPASPYLGGIAEQAQHIRSLQERVAELEEALKRERHRADLCEQQLEQAMTAAAAQAAAHAAQLAAAHGVDPSAAIGGRGGSGDWRLPSALAAVVGPVGTLGDESVGAVSSGSGGVGGLRGAGAAAGSSLLSTSPACAAALVPLVRSRLGLLAAAAPAGPTSEDAAEAVGPGPQFETPGLEAAVAVAGGRHGAETCSDEAGCPADCRHRAAAAEGLHGDVGGSPGPVGREPGAHPEPSPSGRAPAAAVGAAPHLQRDGQPQQHLLGNGTHASPAAVTTAAAAAAAVPRAAGGLLHTTYVFDGGGCGAGGAAADSDSDAESGASASLACSTPFPGAHVGASAVPSGASVCMSGSCSVGGGAGAVGPFAAGEPLVTITKREYELLLLKDKAMDVLQEGITIADCSLPDMPLIYANAGFVRTTGYSTESVLGKNCRFLQGEGTDEASVRELRKAISGGKACVVQLLNYKRTGDPFVNYLSLTPIHDALTGRLTHFVGVQSDITELVNHKRAELAAKHAALQAAVATEAKSQFLARMSHEIRTPLNGMIAVGQLLAETSLTPAQWDLVNTIRCSGETLLTLITAAAAAALDQAAAAATPGAQTAAAAAATGPEADWPLMVIHFSVRDTGIGIAPADLGRLFNSFTQVDASPTRRYGGSGLGLAISRKLCEAMGGQMWVESEGLNKGSTFSWTITCRLPQQAASKRRNRRSSLVCVSRPPAASAAAAAAFLLQGAPGSSGPGSTGGATGGSGSGGIPAGPPPPPPPAAAMLPSPPEEYDATSLHGSESSSQEAGTAGTASSAAAAGGAVVASAGSGSILGPQGGGLGSDAAAATGVAVVGSGAGGSLLQRSSSAAPPLSGPNWNWSNGGVVGGGGGGPTRYTSTGVIGGGGVAAAAGAASSLFENFGLGHGAGAGAAGAGMAGGYGVGAPDLTASLPLLRGKKILLVEPCEMVRQVLMLALRSWGCRVCAVVSARDAVQRLLACGTLAEADAPAAAARAEPPPHCMTLRHTNPSAGYGSDLYDTPGPYDCVILDMKDTVLLRALTRADDREAQRLVFLGWPGQNEPEEEEGGEGLDDEGEVSEDAAGSVPTTGDFPDYAAPAGHRDDYPRHAAGARPSIGGGEDGDAAAAAAMTAPPPRRSQHELGGDLASYAFSEPLLPADVTARPPRAVTDEMARTQNRQLGYVTVTRPVRQGRLKLALEEVLMMQLDMGSQAHVAGPGLADAAAAAAPAAPHGVGAAMRRRRPSSYGASASPFQATAAPDQARAQAHWEPPATAAAAHHEQLQLQRPPSLHGGHGGSSSLDAPGHIQPSLLAFGLTSPSPSQGSFPSSAASANSASIGTVGTSGTAASGQPLPHQPLPHQPGHHQPTTHHSHPPSHHSHHNFQHHAPSHGGSSGGHHSISSLCSSLKPAQVKKSGSSTELAELSGGAAGAGRVRILLAEDNAINMKVALGILKRTLPLAEVVAVENGVQALEVVSARSGIESFDLVLMDLHMPLMGGMEAMAELAARYPNRSSTAGAAAGLQHR